MMKASINNESGSGLNVAQGPPAMTIGSFSVRLLANNFTLPKESICKILK